MYRLNDVNVAGNNLFEEPVVKLRKDTSSKLVDGPEITLVIGPNGSGKSLLLKNISAQIRNDYLQGGIEVPSRLICISPGISDRFHAPERRKGFLKESKFDKFYFYLGKKGTAGSFSARIFLYRCIDYLADWLGNTQKYIYLSDVLNELGFAPIIEIKYQFLFDGKSGPRDLAKIIKERRQLGDSSVPNWFKVDEFTQIFYELASPSRASSFVIDLRSPVEKSHDYLFIRYFNFLRSEKIIKVENCYIQYKDKDFRWDVSDLSSGEANIFLTFLALSSVIRENSLVLIDEPEVSLHPNWQMRYITLLSKIFKNFNSCHFVITTHSPYICSELDNSSTVLRAYKNKRDKFQLSLYECGVHGWSVEKILLEVFGVASVRNFYFEQKIRKLFEYVDNSESHEKVDVLKVISELKKFNLQRDDPLQALINNVENILFKKGN